MLYDSNKVGNNMEEIKRITDSEIEKLYEQYLSVLKEDLVLQNLSKRTVDRTLHRAGDFLYGYLNYDAPLTIQQGVSRIYHFLFSHAPNKFYASFDKVKEYATAVKKLYVCLHRHGYISESDLNSVLDDVKTALSDLRNDGLD